MSKVMSKVVGCVFLTYILFVFISLEPNPFAWHEMGRVWFIMCSFSFAIFFLIVRSPEGSDGQ